MLLDPETEEPFLLYGPEWRLDALCGPRGTPTEQLQRLEGFPTEFRRGAASGYLVPRTVMVPGGQEVTVHLLVYRQERPEIKIPFGVYDVLAEHPNQLPRALPLGLEPITNVAPKALAEFLPRRPLIPGEFVYKGKRLSYWFSRLVPGPALPGRRTGQEGRQEALNALDAAGAAAVPVLLQYWDAQPEFGSMIVRRVADHLIATGLQEEMERLAIEALSSTNTLVQRNALVILPCPAAKAHLPTLAKLVSEGTKEVRQSALETLNRCEVTDGRLLPIYQLWLEIGIEVEQSLILSSLKKFDASAKSLMPAIQTLLEKGSPSLQVKAASTAWSIERNTNVVASMIQILESAVAFPVVIELLQVLGEMGPVAKAAVPAILKRAEQPDQRIGLGVPRFLIDKAAEALRNIEPGSEKKLPNPRMGNPMPPGVRPFMPPLPRVPETPAMPLG